MSVLAESEATALNCWVAQEQIVHYGICVCAWHVLVSCSQAHACCYRAAPMLFVIINVPGFIRWMAVGFF